MLPNALECYTLLMNFIKHWQNQRGWGWAQGFALLCCVWVWKGVKVKMKGSPLLWRRGKGQMCTFLLVLNIRSQVEKEIWGLKWCVWGVHMCMHVCLCGCVCVIDEVYSCGLSLQILWSNRQSISAYWTRGFLYSPPYVLSTHPVTTNMLICVNTHVVYVDIQQKQTFNGAMWHVAR